MAHNLSPVTVMYRIGNFLHRNHVPLIPKLITYTNRIIFSAQIPCQAVIGRNVVFGYWGLGIVIHFKTKIGDNCVIGQNVTIGRNFGDKEVPKIGSNVYIGAGSVVFGEIEIGNNVIIGSNSIVNKSIPDNCTVAGNPFRILKKDRKETFYELDVKSKRDRKI